MVKIVQNIRINIQFGQIPQYLLHIHWIKHPVRLHYQSFHIYIIIFSCVCYEGSAHKAQLLLILQDQK